MKGQTFPSSGCCLHASQNVQADVSPGCSLHIFGRSGCLGSGRENEKQVILVVAMISSKTTGLRFMVDRDYRDADGTCYNSRMVPEYRFPVSESSGWEKLAGDAP